MHTAQLSQKYQIVVPKAVRIKMRLKAGSVLVIRSIDDQRALLMKHPENYTVALRGLGKEVWKSLGGTQQYIHHERSSWDK